MIIIAKRFFILLMISFSILQFTVASDLLAPISVVSSVLSLEGGEFLGEENKIIVSKIEELLNPETIMDINGSSEKMIKLLETIIENSEFIKDVKKEVLIEFIKFSFALVEQINLYLANSNDEVKNLYRKIYYLLLCSIINNCNNSDIIEQISILLTEHYENKEDFLFGINLSQDLLNLVSAKMFKEDDLCEFSLDSEGYIPTFILSSKPLNNNDSNNLLSELVAELKESELSLLHMDYPYGKKLSSEYPKLNDRKLQMMLQYSLRKLKEKIKDARTSEKCTEILIEINNILYECESFEYSAQLIKMTLEVRDICIKHHQIIIMLEKHNNIFNELDLKYEFVLDYIFSQPADRQLNIISHLTNNSEEKTKILQDIKEHENGFNRIKGFLENNNLSIKDLKQYVFKSSRYTNVVELIDSLTNVRDVSKLKEKLKPIIQLKNKGVRHHFNKLNSIHVRMVKFYLNKDVNAKDYVVFEYLNKIEFHYKNFYITFQINENGDLENINSRERCFDIARNKKQSSNQKYAYLINLTEYAKELEYLYIRALMGVDKNKYLVQDIHYVTEFIKTLLSGSNSYEKSVMLWQEYFPKKMHFLFDALEIDSLVKSPSLEQTITLNQKDNWTQLIDYILQKKAEPVAEINDQLRIAKLLHEFNLNEDDLLYYTFLSKGYTSQSELIKYLAQSTESSARVTLSRIWFYKNYGQEQDFSVDEIVSRYIQFFISRDIPFKKFILNEYLDKLVLKFFNEEFTMPIYKTGSLRISKNKRIPFILSENSTKGKFREHLTEQAKELFIRKLRRYMLLEKSDVEDDEVWVAFSVLKDFSLLQSDKKEEILKSILPKNCYHVIPNLISTPFYKLFSEGTFSLEYIQEWSLIINSIAKRERNLIKFLQDLNSDMIMKDNHIRSMVVRGITGSDLKMHYNTLPFNKDQLPFEKDIFEKGDLLNFIKRVEKNKYNGVDHKEFKINKGQEKATCKIRNRQFAIAKGVILKFPGIRFFLEERLDNLKIIALYQGKKYLVEEFDISNGELNITGVCNDPFIMRQKGSQITLTSIINKKINEGTLFDFKIETSEKTYSNSGQSLLKPLPEEKISDDVEWMHKQGFTKETIYKFSRADISKSDLLNYTVQYKPNLILMLSKASENNWDVNSNYLVYQMVQLKKGLITRFNFQNNIYFADIGKQRFTLSGDLIAQLGGVHNISMTRYLDKVTFEVNGEVRLVFQIDSHGKLVDNIGGNRQIVADLSVSHLSVNDITLNSIISQNVYSAA